MNAYDLFLCNQIIGYHMPFNYVHHNAFLQPATRACLVASMESPLRLQCATGFLSLL